MLIYEELKSRIDLFYTDTDKFLTVLQISPANDISISIDCDTSIYVEDCMELQSYLREIYGSDLDEYSLEVSSHGLGEPLLYFRQYVKVKDKLVIVNTTDGQEIEAKLTNVTENEGITLERNVSKTQQKKGIEKVIHLPFESIKKISAVILFK